MALVDVIETAKTLLSDNWIVGNTDSLLPAIGAVYEYSTYNLVDRDLVVIYEIKRLPQKNATGSSTKKREDRVAIDIRSASTRAHAILVLAEVERILDANITSPGTGYDILDPDKGIQDLSDKSRKIFRFVVDVTFKATNVTR